MQCVGLKIGFGFATVTLGLFGSILYKNVMLLLYPSSLCNAFVIVCLQTLCSSIVADPAISNLFSVPYISYCLIKCNSFHKARHYTYLTFIDDILTLPIAARCE